MFVRVVNCILFRVVLHPMGIGTRLKETRIRQGMDVPDLAERSGLSKAYIWQVEAGRRASPSARVLHRLAVALGTTLSDLMDVPQGISEEELQAAPAALKAFFRKKGKALELRREDLEMLKHVHYRGKRPRTSEDYELVFLFLRRILE